MYIYACIYTYTDTHTYLKQTEEEIKETIPFPGLSINKQNISEET